MSDPRVFVFSGPSGSGKTTLIKALTLDPRVHLSVSATTRSPRPKEKDGVDYHFVSEEEFTSLKDRGALIEWASVHGFHYGTPRSETRAQADRPDVSWVILDIDVQGFRQVRRDHPTWISIFITPPSIEDLRRRLEGRGTESPERIATRLRNAAREMEARTEYDHVVVNQDVDQALRTLRHLLGLDLEPGAVQCRATRNETPR